MPRKTVIRADAVKEDTLEDKDGNTKIQVEESDNEDTIRFDVNGSEKMIIDVTGSVGIGTSVPGARLDVQANLTGMAALSVQNTQSSSGHGLIVKCQGNQAGTKVFQLFRAESTEMLTANGNGNIGINQTTPQQELSVGGEIGVADALVHIGDTNTKLEFHQNGGQLNLVGNGKSVFKFDGSAILLNNSNQNYDTQIMADNGNVVLHVDAETNKVGISETNPAYKLDVNGNIGLNQYIYHRGDDNTFIKFDDNEINIECGGRQMIQFKEASNDKVCINNNGVDIDFQVKGTSNTNNLFRTSAGNNRIGIRTDAPLTTLDVNGDVRNNGSVYRQVRDEGNTSNITTSDYCIRCIQTGAITLTLPSKSNNSGQILVIKDALGIAGTHNITITGHGSGGSQDKFDGPSGSTVYTIGTNNGAVTLICDGINGWMIIGKVT